MRRKSRLATSPGRSSREPTPYLAALRTLSVDLCMTAGLKGAALVHSHTWYANFAGRLSQLVHGIPHVMTTHSLEPLRPWKAEQLGGGYRLSSFCEQNAIEAADAVIAVSEGMKSRHPARLSSRSRRARARDPQRHRSRRIPPGSRHRRARAPGHRPPSSLTWFSSGASRDRRASCTCSRRRATSLRTSRSCSARASPTRRRLPPRSKTLVQALEANARRCDLDTRKCCRARR